MRIAEAAVAALGEDHALPDRSEIGEQRLVLVENLGADRHFEHDVGAAGAVTILAHTVAAALCLEMLLVTVVDERVEPVDRFGNDIAALAAIAAIRPAEFDEFLAPERDASVPAIP